MQKLISHSLGSKNSCRQANKTKNQTCVSRNSMTIDLKNIQNEEDAQYALDDIINNLECRCDKNKEIRTILMIYVKKINKLRLERDFWRDKCMKTEIQIRRENVGSKNCKNLGKNFESLNLREHKERSNCTRKDHPQGSSRNLTKGNKQNLKGSLPDDIKNIFELLCLSEGLSGEKNQQKTEKSTFLQSFTNSGDQSLLLSDISFNGRENNLNRRVSEPEIFNEDSIQVLINVQKNVKKVKANSSKEQRESSKQGSARKIVNLQQYISEKLEKKKMIDRIHSQLAQLSPRPSNNVHKIRLPLGRPW